jgi:hypothetical protein
MAAMPARLVLERGDWKAAAALPITTPESPVGESLTRFTRGYGMARTGDLAGARAELEAMQALRSRLEKSDNSYWADRTEEADARGIGVGGIRGRQRGARGAIHARRGRPRGRQRQARCDGEQALPDARALRRAAARDGRPEPALREFEVALKAYPNRYRTVFGIARAADAAGDRRKARNTTTS